ncbi:flavin containing amine oxidoreductase [Hirsutella rhossiliensis]|uniref:Amine oxidase n=1 Tax=Hirsutella rhossiliensis TaxID=111463 RepID=A0A9P8MXV9_9HYPO|nr:flavin containing amine oxidoreductase domain-containing protein [Hirsutella rhossiliensis]KAH0962291.1 flavin containing amine oxidoreductase domain-containing protein [Hirsutella rhossiliensis]
MAAVQVMAPALPSRQRRSAAVIVVGAGLSGLQAAHHIQSSGSSCLLLEATDCVGGRFAQGPGRHGFDGARHVRMAELARRLGLGVESPQARQGEEDTAQGLGACGADGIPEGFTADDRRALIRVRTNVEALCQRVDVNRPAELMPNYGTMTVRELVASQGGTAAVQHLANSWTLTLFGLGCHRVSALYFLVHCKCGGGLLQTLSDLAGGSQNLRVSGGVSRLCEELVARLQPGSVLLSQHVDRIDQTPGNRCVLTTRSGEVFQCAKVILAGAASQCRTIDFAPDLGADKQWLRDPAHAGFSRSMILLFDQPWWRERGFSGRAQALDGPMCMVLDSSSDDADTLSALTCLVAGESGQELWLKPEDDRRQDVLRNLEAIFGEKVPFPAGVMELGPETDTLACLAVPAAHLRDLERDHWRPEGSIFFAGSAASFVSRGHPEGALAAGSRASEEVVCALQPTLGAGPVPRL